MVGFGRVGRGNARELSISSRPRLTLMPRALAKEVRAAEPHHLCPERESRARLRVAAFAFTNPQPALAVFLVFDEGSTGQGVAGLMLTAPP